MLWMFDFNLKWMDDNLFSFAYSQKLLQNSSDMASFKKTMQNILKAFDLFPTQQYLRYKEEPDYKTATGGAVSIAILVIFIIMFYSLGMQTVNQKIINGSVSYQIDTEPVPLSINFTKGSEFMFGIGILGLDLNDPNIKYFDISLRQNYFTPLFRSINSTVIPLVACTPDHFNHDSDILKLYYQFNFSRALCPPFGYEFQVKGIITSDVMASFSIFIEYCNQTINPKCISDAGLKYIYNTVGDFTMMVQIISTIVNPGQEKYKQVYLQDQNYYFFNLNNGLTITGQIQQYQIGTDVSLMPYTDIRSQFITTIPQLLKAKSKSVTSNQYVQIMFTKSSTSTIFARSFNKIDDYFSYVGGLVGTVLLFFFILSGYSEKSYVIEIASQVFKPSDDSDKPPSFHFLHYLTVNIKKLFDFINLKFQWKQPDAFIQQLEEMEKQLSIQYIFNRLSYFQQAISSILSQQQLQILYLNQKKTIKDGESIRKKHNLPLSLTSRLKLKQSDNKISNESSCKMLDSNQNQASKISITIQEVPKLSRLDLINQQLNSCSLAEDDNQEVSSRIKENLMQIINQSNLGNQISGRILSKMNKKIFPEIGLSLSQPQKQQNPPQEFAVSHQPQKSQEPDPFQYLK